MLNINKVKKRINELKKEKKIVIIGIAGGSSSGKTYLAKKLNEEILSMDDYFKGIKYIKDGNFDKPSALDLNLLRKQLIKLRNNKNIKKPVYDFKTHSRIGYEIFKPSKVIILDGLYALHKKIADLIDLKIFVDSSEKSRLERRIKRDVKFRGRTKESVIKQWNESVEKMFKLYILPTKKYADIVIKN